MNELYLILPFFIWAIPLSPEGNRDCISVNIPTKF
jgi:hypothetical protein